MVRKWTIWVLLSLSVFALLPVALIVRARTSHTTEPRLHVFPDMDSQPKYKTQRGNPLFADTRAMRPPVEGTVARGRLHADDYLYRGIENGEWAAGFPMAVTHELMDRGRQRFDIYCAPCHGMAGYGDGIVARTAEGLAEGTWVQPSSYHTDLVKSRRPGHIFNTITHGIRNMPPYGFRIEPEDRWAIVAYVQALQLSQQAEISDVPEQHRASVQGQ
jgi:mono/diheme cytochrome c family protein